MKKFKYFKNWGVRLKIKKQHISLNRKKRDLLLNKRSFKLFRDLNNIDICSVCGCNLKNTDKHHFLCSKCWREKNGDYAKNRYMGWDYEQKYKKFLKNMGDFTKGL